MRVFCSKSYRDKRNYYNIMLYHVSSNKVGVPQPISRFHGQTGIYVTKSYKSLITDWMGYVQGKKNRQHPLSTERRKVTTRMNELDDIEKKMGALSEAERKEYDDLDKKLEKINASTVDNKSHDLANFGYKTLYVHRISCPRSVYEEAKKRFMQSYDAGYRKGDFGFWMWGDQTFIPSDLLKHLQVIDVKSMNFTDFQDEYRSLLSNRHLTPSLKPKPKRGGEEIVENHPSGISKEQVADLLSRI